MFSKTNPRKKEAKNIDTEIALEKKVKELDNIVYKMGQSAQTVQMLTKPKIRPMLYDGNVIAKETNVISIVDFEETLMLEEESRSKMLLKQSDPMVLEKKVNTKPINYAELNRLSEDFDKQCFEIQKKQSLIENDRLLDQIISQDIVNIVLNSSLDENTSVNVNSFVAMNDSVNCVERCNKCLELEAELIKQHNMLQAKDTTIKKLRAHIKRINETSTSESVKKDFDEIETINIELEHRVTRLIAKNEHLKQAYKQLYDSIKPSRVRAKEQTESLVNQVNQKSVEISDLNAQLQEKDCISIGHNNLAPKVIDNEESITNTTFMHLIQELLGYVRYTCHDIHKPSEKLVTVTPINKKKIVLFVDTVTSSGNIPKVTNRPILSSTRVNPSTSASRSKPSGNTKNDRISRTPKVRMRRICRSPILGKLNLV
ncbi:hypothetical protein Tco_0138912 [Tanacetum coccineum]